MVSPREAGVNLFTVTSLMTKQNVYYQRLLTFLFFMKKRIYKRSFIFHRLLHLCV